MEDSQRDGEYKYRSYLRGFVTVLTEGSMQDITVARVQEYRLPSPPSFNVMYCVRDSLWTVKIFITLEEGVVGNLCISLEDSVGWGDFERHGRKGKEDIVILRLVGDH